MRTICALLVLLSTAGALVGQDARPNATFPTGGPSTTNNDDSCDIGVFPAATLLLPYFEVDMTTATGETTIFTITNTTDVPQVARVTLWTDYSFPVMHFSIFLTGYDVQSISLGDVIRNGIIAPPAGTGATVSPQGTLSASNNPVLNESSCNSLPGTIPFPLLSRVQAALTTGKIPGSCGTAGSNHPARAIGYATIDVTGDCGDAIPTDASYYSSEIRFDNVLIGDYQQLNFDLQSAQGNELVHIRAMPEGGTPATRIGAPFVNNFPRTFYNRYVISAETRQPLPSLWAARWIDGGPSGFRTRFKIWREGSTTGVTACSAYPILGGRIGVTEIVRFDEDENPETFAGGPAGPFFLSTSSLDVGDPEHFPPNTGGDVAGWMYLNLDSFNSTGNPPASQSWVTVSMAMADLFSVDFAAAALGNGCTPETDRSRASGGLRPIGPAPNINPE